MKILNFGSLNIDYVYSVDHFVNKGETLSSDGLHVVQRRQGAESVHCHEQSRG